LLPPEIRAAEHPNPAGWEQNFIIAAGSLSVILTVPFLGI